METTADNLTPSQRQAVAARGNVLVMAGAGTGKTRTLVERCLDCLCNERASLDEMLIVTFTDAAAAEVRQRIAAGLEKKSSAQPGDSHWNEQLALFDTAHVGTLHGFCLRLVREHFYELGLDPQLAILDAGEARLLANETLDEQFKTHYAGQNEFSLAVQNLIRIYGNGDERPIRAILLRLHHYAQTRPDADRWLARQREHFAAPQPVEWRGWMLDAIRDWRDEWLPVLENLRVENEKAVELLGLFSCLGSAPAPDAVGDALVADVRREGASNRTRDAYAPHFSRELVAEILEQILATDGKENFPKGKFGVLRKPFENLFDEAAFFASLATVKDGNDPLAEDWSWVHGHMEMLLRLAQEFAGKFSERKLDDGVLDFHDLEQFALKLLWDSGADKPTTVAERWREKIRFVFVDEYQDINAAQDKIISALSRDEWWRERPREPISTDTQNGARGRSPHHANRFLVGDVKQSIYRFRLADPKIFRDYARDWRGENGQTIPLSENFRSRESLLGFVNSIFSLVMREEIGGVAYDVEAQLKFGQPESRAELGLEKNPSPRAELLLRFINGRSEEADDDELPELEEAEKEARLITRRFRELVAQGHEIWDDQQNGFRAVEWRDMAVLLRAPSGKSESFAKEFERAGVPLSVVRSGFYDSSEILDLLNLLQLLDNPLQDVPAIAVLRSPLVGLSLDELAEIRLAAKDVNFWTALNRIQNEKLKIKSRAAEKIPKFLERFTRWRKLSKQNSLSQCLEEILAETHYAEWLQSRPRGAQRCANVGQFLHLAQQFDQFQRHSLFHFLKFIEAQQAADSEPEVATVAAENAVRLMSIHQSKGLEFPVVAVADLAKNFNEQDLRGEIIFDEQFGLCPRVKPPHTGRRYPSLPHWLAQRHQRRELRGEELRLLYVALTRARDTLILAAQVSEKKWETVWTRPGAVTAQKIVAAKSFADWFGLWFSQNGVNPEATQGELRHLHWRVVNDEELADEVKTESGKRQAEMELPELDDAMKEKLQKMLSWHYEFGAATVRAAKSSMTMMRRQAEELEDEALQIFTRPTFAAKRRKAESGKRKLNAAETGVAHHKFLQHFALEKISGLAAEAERLARENYLSADERDVLDLEMIAAFWNSNGGRKIQKHAAEVKREFAFTAKFSPTELDEIFARQTSPELTGEFVVVQGVADLVVLLPQEIWIVDFKTDEVNANDSSEKTKFYAPQLKLYSRALAKIYSRPVTNCWLHFLSARKTVSVEI
jgi:ATP-dependent helicase/nuclease subunit A